MTHTTPLRALEASSPRARTMVCVLLVIALGSCSDAGKPPTAPVNLGSGQRDILDGARHGNPHFFFLPPLLPQPTYSGTSNPSASPTVLVCEWNTTVPGGQCGAVVASFSAAQGTASEVVTYDGASQKYSVNWHTDRCVSGPCTLDPARTYRIRILAGAIELGHADVDVVANGNELRNVDTRELVPLLSGRTMPIKFRIENGAVTLAAPGASVAISTAGGEITSSDGQVALSIPNGALGASTPITINAPAETRPGTGAWSAPIELGPDGTTFAQPVQLTIGYDVRKLPEGVIPEALKLSTWAGDHWEQVASSSLNAGDATVSAPITHFSTYALVIWPNTVQGATSPTTQVFVGEQATYGGSAWYWTTVPNTYCYTYRVWISGFFGGYWSYAQRCNTYQTTYNYGVSGALVAWSSGLPSVASVAAPGYSITTANGTTTSPTVTGLAPGSSPIIGRLGSLFSSTTLTVVARPVIDPFPQAGWQNVMTVVAGRQGSSTVPVSNAGGGVLSDLAMTAPSVDCYSGQPYTWLIGAWNTTTAPAILTLTASPPSDLPPGDYDHCFNLTGTASGALPRTYGVRVSVTPAFVTIDVQQNPASVRPGQSVQLTSTARDENGRPVVGVRPTWSSSNPAVATVDANGRVVGVANGTAGITAVANGVHGAATVYVGTPTIAFAPSTVTIPVVQGRTNIAEINITNSGTGLLTGLSAGTFTDYFNGSPAPWVTATLNTTTAPATLTITATPGLSIPAGVHQLRFDVNAPGASNTPVTFYAINVTVIAAGVTPVNATISANPSSVSFSVTQGQSASAHIAITNSGSDPLTHLTVGSFSNYFNGQAAPWVTATVSPSDAPATITITAAPALNAPTGTTQLRFDMASPGATNSPYTFYSINVTVLPAPPTPAFTMTDLGTIGGGGTSEALAINRTGRIVGVSNQRGFYMNATATAPTDVPNPYGDISWAYDVNESGVIAATQPYSGYTFDPTTNAFAGPPPGPFTQNNRRMVFALNNIGQVLACADNGSYSQNFVWTIATNVVSLIPDAYNFCYGKINDGGVAIVNADPGAGGNSRLWNEATQSATLIPSLGGVTIGRDLNASSIAVGSSQVGGRRHAFRYDLSNGSMRDLGTLGGDESEAMGINDAGYIVGWSRNAAGQTRGFLWDPTQQKMFELAPLAGHDESQANDINQGGVIVGFSAIAGVRRAVRWTPQ